MKRQVVCGLTVLAVSCVGSVAIGAEGQEREPARAVRHAIELEKAQLEGKLRAAVEMKTTTGAPYSAEATTETVQMLADGNRIARKTIVRIYRDSDGRTRREFVTADGSRVESVAIVDPVAGSSVMIDPRTKTIYGHESRFVVARGSSTRVLLGDQVKPGEPERKREIEMSVQGPPPPPPAPPMPGALRRSGPGGSPEHTNREDLGQRTVEGVVARGTRTTTVIPAGAIGNEHPIRIVSEEWFSPELQILVLTKHSDPRSGDTTYTLSGIIRGEPDRSLFEVPADYTRR